MVKVFFVNTPHLINFAVPKKAALVNRLRRLSFTEEGRVRFPYAVPEGTGLRNRIFPFFLYDPLPIHMTRPSCLFRKANSSHLSDSTFKDNPVWISTDWFRHENKPNRSRCRGMYQGAASFRACRQVSFPWLNAKNTLLPKHWLLQLKRFRIKAFSDFSPFSNALQFVPNFFLSFLAPGNRRKTRLQC